MVRDAARRAKIILARRQSFRLTAVRASRLNCTLKLNGRAGIARPDPCAKPACLTDKGSGIGYAPKLEHEISGGDQEDKFAFEAELREAVADF